MKRIKIKAGGAGIKYTDANGTVRHALKTPQNGPFMCDDEQAERLVGLGVAEYVGTVAEPEKAEPETEKITGRLLPEELETWDYDELKKFAAEIGVKPEGKKKADYIAAIAAVDVEIDPEELDDDELPEMGVADPE